MFFYRKCQAITTAMGYMVDSPSCLAHAMALYPLSAVRKQKVLQKVLHETSRAPWIFEKST